MPCTRRRYADYSDLNNFFAVNWINYPTLWLSYFLRMSASRKNGNGKRKSDETSYVEVLAAVAPIAAGSRNFRRLIEIKESSLPASIAESGLGSLRLRGCNKRPDFHRNDQRLTNRTAVRPHSTISTTFFRCTMISYDTTERNTVKRGEKKRLY